jgi:predicted PurR-regulated permease PerM
VEFGTVLLPAVQTPGMPTNQTLPFYVKFSLNLLTIILIGGLIFIGQDILMPLFFAIVLAILLLPVNNRLVKWGIPKVPSMLLSILLALLFIGGVIYFLSSQVAVFVKDLPAIKQHLNDHVHTVQKWVSETFHYSYKEQDKAMQEATSGLKDSGGSVVGTTLISAMSALLMVILLPIYTFLIMYYRGLIRKFFMDIFADRHRSSVEEVMQESKTIVQGYMVGLLIEMAIVAALNTTGFLIIGIKYSIFLAVLAAILNMIPYVGMLVATVLCMLITLTTSTQISDILWVAVVLTIVQFIDNNLLMPYVVSSKVRINALVSIIGVLIGGALAGISGMFLSIPGIAIMKAIFDRVQDLKPWGMLMGDDLSMLNQRKRKMIQKGKGA